MAKTKNKKKNKGTSANSNQGLIKTAKAYFESGRLAKLPLDKIYYGKDDFIEGQFMHTVIITRRHVNGNISYATFAIYDGAGIGDVMLTEFNSPEEEMDKFLETTVAVAAPSEYPSLLRLIKEAKISSSLILNRESSRYEYGYLILPTDEELKALKDWQGASAPLASFQTAQSHYFDPEKIFLLNHNYTVMDLDFKAGVYSSSLFSDWTRQQWQAFLSEDYRSSVEDESFHTQHMPYMYILEKVILEGGPTGKPAENRDSNYDKETEEVEAELTSAINKDLDNLEHNAQQIQSKLISTWSSLPESYQPSELERLYENTLAKAIYGPSFLERPNKIISKIQSLIETYPDNHEFKYYLALALLQADTDWNQAVTLLENNIALEPENALRILQYFDAIWEIDDISFSDIIDQWILNDKHLLSIKHIYEPHLHAYYLKIAEYLKFMGWPRELLRLYKIISTYPLFKQSDDLQKRWLALFHENHLDLVTYKNNLTEKELETWLDMLVSSK